MAYATLQSIIASWTCAVEENTRKAYELRDRVSEREKLTIESFYHQMVTGDLEKARQAYELWAQTYPRDFVPPTNLSNLDFGFGQYDKALAEAGDALRLDPLSGNNYENLAFAYFFLDRMPEAQATIEEAHAKKLDTPFPAVADVSACLPEERYGKHGATGGLGHGQARNRRCVPEHGSRCDRLFRAA